MRIALLLLTNLFVSACVVCGQSPERRPLPELDDVTLPTTLVDPEVLLPVAKHKLILPDLSPGRPVAAYPHPGWVARRIRNADKSYWLMTAGVFGSATFGALEERACKQRHPECTGYGGGYILTNYVLRFGFAGFISGITYYWKRDSGEHDKSWLVWPIGYIGYALVDGIHSSRKNSDGS